MSTSVRTFRVKMIDSGGEFVLYVMADNAEHARVVANCDWTEALFINVTEVA